MFEFRPLAILRVTSPFGERVINGELDDHGGVDYAADETTPLFAMGDGRIEKAGDGVAGVGGGLAVAILDDDDGRLFYLHLSRLDVATGERVRAGQRIGFAGRSGRVTGPHLHLQWQPRGVGGAVADIAPVVAALPPPPEASSGSGGAAAMAIGIIIYAILSKRRRR